MHGPTRNGSKHRTAAVVLAAANIGPTYSFTVPTVIEFLPHRRHSIQQTVSPVGQREIVRRTDRQTERQLLTHSPRFITITINRVAFEAQFFSSDERVQWDVKADRTARAIRSDPSSSEWQRGEQRASGRPAVSRRTNEGTTSRIPEGPLRRIERDPYSRGTSCAADSCWSTARYPRLAWAAR